MCFTALRVVSANCGKRSEMLNFLTNNSTSFNIGVVACLSVWQGSRPSAVPPYICLHLELSVLHGNEGRWISFEKAVIRNRENCLAQNIHDNKEAFEWLSYPPYVLAIREIRFCLSILKHFVSTLPVGFSVAMPARFLDGILHWPCLSKISTRRLQRRRPQIMDWETFRPTSVSKCQSIIAFQAKAGCLKNRTLHLNTIPNFREDNIWKPLKASHQ